MLCTNVYTYSLLSLWILNCLHFSACCLNFSELFTPKQWILSFLLKVLLQMRYLSSSSILDKLKKEGDSRLLWYSYYIICAVSSFSFIYMFKLFWKDVKLETNQYAISRLYSLIQMNLFIFFASFSFHLALITKKDVSIEKRICFKKTYWWLGINYQTAYR